MSLILLVSIAIRIAAFVWSIVILHRTKDRIVGSIAFMLGLMTLRQVLTLLVERKSWVVSITTHMTEIPGLIVSIITLIIIIFINHIITERRRTDEELKEKEQMIESLIAYAPYSIWICNGEGTIVFANQASLKLFGVNDPSQIIGTYNIYSHTTEEEKPFLAYFERAQSGEIVHYRHDLDMTKVKYNTSRREILHFYTTLFAIPTGSNGGLNIVAVQEDITDRVKKEHRIRHLQNVLSAIRSINQLIVREKNRERLLQSVCEILTRTRDYKTAWIGLVQEGTEEVLPAARAGFNKEDSTSSKTLLNGASSEREPVRVAIKTGKPFVVRNIEQELKRSQWLKDALNSRCNSLAAIPLLYEKKVYGALIVYASDMDFFDNEEENLLTEIGRDIAFALNNIDLERDREALLRETQESLNRLTAVYHASKGLQWLYTPDTLAQEIIQVMEETLNYEYSAVLLLDETSGRLIPYALSDQGRGTAFIKKDKAYVDSHDIRIGLGITGWVAHTGQSVLVNDVRKDPRYYPMRKNIRSELCVPLRAGEKTIGVVNIETARLNAYSEADQQVLETMAAQIAIAIQNARLYEQVQRHSDELENQVAERTKELAHANIRLKELDKLKSEFLAMMSHELRTPLNSIIGFVGIILKGIPGKINDEQKKQLSMVYNSAKHLLSLINDILDLSRIESGKMEISMENFKIEDVINEVVQTMSLPIEQKGLKLITEVPDKMPYILSDKKRAFQILLNLVNNAYKFTEKGEIKIECKIESNILKIAVSDTGIGIKNEDMPYLFEAFRQVDGTARRRYQGAGLGLYLCKKLLTLLGGEITAESEYGRGSRFTFKLPIKNIIKDIE